MCVCQRRNHIALIDGYLCFQSRSAFVVFPFARGRGDVQVLLEPREQTGQLDGPVCTHGSRYQVELRTPGTNQSVRAPEIDEQPALDETGGVVREQRPALDELHRAFDRQLRLGGRQASPGDLGFHGCGEKRR